MGALLRQAWPGSMVRMTEALANGVALGWNPRKTERAMREAGRSVLQRALLIARTEQLRAYRTASLANYRASGVLSGYRRLAAKSARSCLACLLADGEFFTLEVAFEEHVAGRCTMVPVLASGEAPEWETGRDWFGRQPEATQRRVMGPAAFEAWRAGVVGLDELVERHEHPMWGGSLQVRSLKRAIGEGEARRWVDLAMGRAAPLVAVGPVTPSWQPSMSRSAADAWAVNSAIKQDVHHVTTSAANKQGIMTDGFDLARQEWGRVWGNGVYVAVDDATTGMYRKWIGKDAETLTIRLNVKKPFVYRATVSNPKPEDILLAATGRPRSDMAAIAQLVYDRNGKCILEIALRDLGFDALHIIPLSAESYVGGNQIVVFDPHDVVVIDDN